MLEKKNPSRISKSTNREFRHSFLFLYFLYDTKRWNLGTYKLSMIFFLKMFCEVNFKHVFYCVSWHKAVCVHIFCEIFPKRVISSQASFDLSQKPKSDIWDIVGGPRRSNEQSLPAYPFSHVQFPDNIKQRNLNIIKIINLTNLRILVIRPSI